MILANLSPSESVRDYHVPSFPGTWELVLDTDEKRFAGLARLAPGQLFHAVPAGHGGLEIKVYLPARCAMILRLCR
jgi:1,4-alpha-glucan branching enzyme